MENKSLELFIKTCGFERKSGEVLNLTQQTISSMRCGRTKIHNKKAKAIVEYLRLTLGLVITPESLITLIEKKKREVSHSALFNNIPIQLSSIYLEKIINLFNKDTCQLNAKIYSEKLIIIDEFYYLISDEETYFYCLQNNKKIVKGCKIFLQESD